MRTVFTKNRERSQKNIRKSDRISALSGNRRWFGTFVLSKKVDENNLTEKPSDCYDKNSSKELHKTDVVMFFITHKFFHNNRPGKPLPGHSSFIKSYFGAFFIFGVII